MPTPAWRIVHSEASRGWGGQERRVMAELLGFRARGHTVGLLAPERASIFSEAALHDLTRATVAEKRWAFPFEVVRTARWLRAFRADVVNTHSSRDGWIVGLAARLARTPLVIRSRHIDVRYPNAWISRHAFAHLCDHVITTSDKISKHLTTCFALPPTRVSTVATGIDLQQFHPAVVPAEIALAGGLPGVPLVGMISVLRSWKGHATFFAAARQLREQGRRINFVVVGGGNPLDAYQAMARVAGVGDCVTFTGHREDVPELLRALSVLVIPSTQHEGVPQIGLQALASRTPVVGSDCGGIPEIIHDGKTGRIFPAGDAGALASNIAAALEQADVSRQMSARGRELVERCYSRDTMLDRLEEIYRRHLL